MRVTVVIPTYERPSFLDGAIQTALGQSYEDLDVVVVDDGSEKRYAEKIVAEYPDTVSCVRHDENQGLSAARNTGVTASTGKYVAFLDDDDRWHREKIRRQVIAIERDPEAAIATCLVAAITPDNEVVHCEFGAPSGDCSAAMLRGNKIGTPSRVLIRRSSFDAIGGFDESLPTKQDWDFYLRMCQHWRVAAVEDHLCFRTVHESMSSAPIASDRDNMAILEKHEGTIREAGEWTTANAEIHERVGRAYLQAGDMNEAKSHLFASVRRGLTLRRGTMFVLSYTNPAVVNIATAVKRRFVANQRDCSEIDLSPETVPGINAE